MESLRASRAETPGGQTNWRLSRVPSKHFSQFGLSVWPAIVKINTYMYIYINYSWLIGPGGDNSQFEISIKIFFFSSCFKLVIDTRRRGSDPGPGSYQLYCVQ